MVQCSHHGWFREPGVLTCAGSPTLSRSDPSLHVLTPPCCCSRLLLRHHASPLRNRRWDRKYWATYKVLDILQKVFYRSNPAREAFVEMCEDSYVQKMTFDSYLYKTVVPGGCCVTGGVWGRLCGGRLVSGVSYASCVRNFSRTTVLAGMQRC